MIFLYPRPCIHSCEEPIYQALGLIPERGGDRKSAEYKEKNQTGIVGVCFSDDTAQKIGVSPSSIFQLIQISKNIGHDLKAEIRGTFLAFELRQLLKLARIKDPKEQRAAAEAYISGEADTITVPKKRAPTKTDRQLWEIDENLMRAELGPAEMAEHTAKRAEVVKQKVELGKLSKTNSDRSQNANKGQAGFDEETAKATGKAREGDGSDAQQWETEKGPGPARAWERQFRSNIL